MTVKEVIEKIKKESGASIPDGQTCDILISGEPDMEVKKIGCTFMATVDVIREAAAQGINFLITHEPTWFNGPDKSAWVEADPVYLAKKKLIEECHMAIWRYHDHMHMGQEDQIYTGFEEAFGWQKYRVAVEDVKKYNEADAGAEQFWAHFGGLYEIPETTLRDLAAFFKEHAQMDVVQIVGNPDMKAKKVSVLVGGGSLGLGREEAPMIQMLQENVDVVICGDITEWTLSAYVRDAAMLGMNKGMLVLGHERSEEWGMKYLTGWVERITGGIPTVFLDAGEPFAYL